MSSGRAAPIFGPILLAMRRKPAIRRSNTVGYSCLVKPDCGPTGGTQGAKDGAANGLYM